MQLIFGKEDAANNFNRFYYTIDKEIVDLCLNRIGKLANQITGLLVFKAFWSDSGSSSSKDSRSTMVRSLRSFWESILLLKSLLQFFSRKTLCSLPISSFEDADVAFMFDNETVYNVCRKNIDIERLKITN